VVWLTGKLDQDRFDSLLVTGVVDDNEENMDYFAESNGVKFLRVPELKRKISLNDFMAIVKIYRIISDFEPDIIHTHTSKAGFLGGLAGMLHNIRRFIGKKRPVLILHTFHGHTFNSYFSPLWRRVFLLTERFLSSFSFGRQMIVTVSIGQKEEILHYLRLNGHVKRQLPTDSRKTKAKEFSNNTRRSGSEVMVIPLGIDLEPFFHIKRLRGKFRSEFRIPDDTLIVGWVGRLAPIKNPALFLEVALKCREICSQPVCFVLAGEGELRGSLQKKAEMVGIDDSVLFIGNRRDMCSVWADMDILVLSSNNEGTPVSILEAMACGVPVVATDVGGVKEIIMQDWEWTTNRWHTTPTPHPRGLLVNPQDAQMLAAAVKKLIDNEPHRRELGQAGPSYVKKVHHIKRLISDMEKLYLQITGLQEERAS
jgi:glycosyltransferase involved in cell wall biosynthesis